MLPLGYSYGMGIRVVSVAVLVLVACVFVAANASGEQRAYTCGKSAATLNYTDGHCTTSGAGAFGSTLIGAAGTKISATNEKTAAGTTAVTLSRLKGKIGVFVTEIQCQKASASGELTNAAKSVTGTGTITYSSCTVTLPAEKGCFVKGGFAVTTKTLTLTTVGQAANKIEIAPKEGTEIATIEFEGCSNPSLNNEPFRLTGRLVANTSGATLTTGEVSITEQGSLKWGPGNPVAGLEGALTFSVGSDAAILE